MTVVDVGCGSGEVAPFPWRDCPDVKLIGIDVDPAAAQNRLLDRFVQLDGSEDWPIESGSADLVIARYVLEHVADSQSFLGNVRRILKPGGRFIFLTPNRRHPTMIVSKYMPLGLKRRLLDILDAGGGYATFYRLNTVKTLKRLAGKLDFQVEQLAAREHEPTGYLDFSIFGFAVAWVYYAAVTRTGLERQFGKAITGVFRKS